MNEPETEKPTGPETPENAPMKLDRRVLEFLSCPVTQTTLEYNAASQELISRAARLAFPIIEGVPIMLVREARELDDHE